MRESEKLICRWYHCLTVALKVVALVGVFEPEHVVLGAVLGHYRGQLGGI